MKTKIVGRTEDHVITIDNMVIKIDTVKVNGAWTKVVKLSDNPIKHTGGAEAVDLAKKSLGIN